MVCSDRIDGAIAQLGERLVCIQKVCGSIPHGSTTYPGDRGCITEVRTQSIVSDEVGCVLVLTTGKFFNKVD